MKMLNKKIILLLIIVQSLNCFSQSDNFEKDSILTTSISKDFFDWYILVAKSGQSKEYNPIEIEGDNGMTTLDFSRYLQNLIDHSFSDSLILKEKQSYNECVRKLSSVKYSEYLKLEDLSDFENLDDDFTNYYRWTGGQEMYDIYTVTKVKLDSENVIVIGNLYFDNTGVEKREFVNEIMMTFIKQNENWKILDIE